LRAVPHAMDGILCRNCGHTLAPHDAFCSQCGQDAHSHPPSLFEFVHEWVLHYLALEGKLWKSLWALMARPGFLTLEYLAGRKQRWVLPLRLLLTLGLLFFFTLKFSGIETEASGTIEAAKASAQAPEAASAPQGGGGSTQGLSVTLGQPGPATSADDEDEPAGPAPASEPVARTGSVPASAAPAAVQAGAAPAEPQVGISLPDGTAAALPAGLRRQIDAVNERARKDPHGELRRVGKKALSMAPYAVLISLPFFAGLLKLLFWRLPYGAHFVFAMHLHAAWYGVMLLLTLTPWVSVALGLWVWMNLYPVWALRRVHRIGWPAAIAKSAVLAFLHWFLIAAAGITVFLLGALSID
jgi:hypothetical protein